MIKRDHRVHAFGVAQLPSRRIIKAMQSTSARCAVLPAIIKLCALMLKNESGRRAKVIAIPLQFYKDVSASRHLVRGRPASRRICDKRRVCALPDAPVVIREPNAIAARTKVGDRSSNAMHKRR